MGKKRTPRILSAGVLVLPLEAVTPWLRAAGVLLLLFSTARLAFAQGIVINEIHYEAVKPTVHEEFVELYNTGQDAEDLSGWFFSSGIAYSFPAGTIVAAGGYAVIAQDPATIQKNFGVNALGPFEGILSNEGERLVLRNADADVIDEVEYGLGFPWPTASSGDGSSMELINPLLDNNLGGSWRPSGWIDPPEGDRAIYLDAQDPAWHYRKGTSEASSPTSAWRERDFVENGTWATGKTIIGYGGAPSTTLDDMKGNYTSVYLRHRFTVPAGPLPSLLLLGVWVDDGAVVWINGVEVARLQVAAGDPPSYNGKASKSHAAAWQDVFVRKARRFLVQGENVIAIHALIQSVSSPGFAIDARLYVPGKDDFHGFASLPPTPGHENTVFMDNAPPQIRQVKHLILEPAANQPNFVTAKISDPDGVRSVQLEYQVVVPGEYVPALLPVPIATLLSNANTSRPVNPDFEDPVSWTTVDMTDDGLGADDKASDGIYSAAIPNWDNRCLVRYRIAATDQLGASIRAPYLDDPSRNFAYFIYNGVPDYAVATSIGGKATVYPADQLTALPVYFLLTRENDLLQCIAANAADQIPQGTLARFAENWEGTFVYEGIVYDHIQYRLRGANGRYQIPPTNPSNIAGKRHWHFKFNKGHHLQARDRFGKPYAIQWRQLIVGRMFGNRLDGNWGISEQVNDIIWNAHDVASPYDHPFHWRVILYPDEVPAGATGQYLGDFWGMAWAQQNYDGMFLEERGLPKGNLYKLINQTDDPIEQEHYQSPWAVSDGSDHNNIQYNCLPSQTEQWLLAYVDYDEWYRYHAIVQAVRHYDYWPEANKNVAWYFEPDYRPENRNLGRLATFPFDTDATWGPTWNSGQDRPYFAIYGAPGKPNMQLEYRNHIREVRDILWQKDQLEPVLRQVAAFEQPLEQPDIDRWRNATAKAGRQYFPGPAESTLEGKIKDMLNFAFVGGSWTDAGVGAGGRAAFLDSLADGSLDSGKLPKQPTASYVGPAGYPADSLTFQSSDFAHPKPEASFGAMKWRIAEITVLPKAAGSIPLTDPIWKTEPVHLEMKADWRSEDLIEFDPLIAIPPGVAEPGKRYRVRVRMMDSTNRWGHWSAPVEFTAGPPAGTIPQVEGLRITEIMYNPPGGPDFEFIELQNRGSGTLDLEDVAIGGGVQFAFRDGRVLSLGAGQFVLVVSNEAVFAHRYVTAGIRIAGQYSGNLDNKGEGLILTMGKTAILDFTYDRSWYPATDGGGFSLVVLDVSAPRDSWGKPSAWNVGSVFLGTPGSAESGATVGSMHPGDANGDGGLDISDAVATLGFLFLGNPVKLPCGDGSASHPGNLSLMDWQPDGAIDISDAVSMLFFFFLDGPPHALAVPGEETKSCIRIVGCLDLCGQ